jgi:pimeloyl-ACP methyl ester carboxylesterase
MTATATTVRNGDAELHVVQRGAGPDVLLLCGLSDPLEVWDAQVEPLMDRYRFTVHDTRGVGRTKAPVESITVPNLASDAATIIRELGLERPHVMGFSGGGHVAMELAITYPELVGSLVLCTTFSEADELSSAKLEAWMLIAEHAPSPEAFMRMFLSSIYTRAAHADGRVDRWIEEALAFEPQMTGEAFLATVKAYAESETTSGLHRIAVPTLLIAGEHDHNVPPPYSRDIAARIPGAELVVMPEQGHQPFHEVPEEYNALVTGFWERIAA